MDIKEMRAKLVNDFSHLWELNDKGHREPHFRDVEMTGIVIRDRLGLEYTDEEIFLTAYFHDMFAWSRYNHHELSHTWVKTTDYPLIQELDRDTRMRIARGCLCHRASFQGAFSCSFSEFFNAADRCMPTNVQALLMRAVQYREKNFPHMSLDKRIEDSIKHLKMKYGTGGYARYPDIYLKVFGEELAKQREAVDKL